MIKLLVSWYTLPLARHRLCLPKEVFNQNKLQKQEEKMKKHLLKSFLLAFTVFATLQAQSFSGSYQMTGVHVGYTNVARVPESPEDSIANYLVEAHWPSVAASVFSAPLLGFAPGDTIVLVETPDILLTPFGLSAYGIELSLALDQDAGSMLIPGVEGTSNTYPTTDTENCSTFLSIAPVTDNANIEYTTTTNSYNATGGTFTWGFGISQSTVFDWFSAPADWENPGKNNGTLKGTFNSDQSGFDVLEVNWLAEDGQETDSGTDGDGLRNRHLGITIVPGDTVTVAALAASGLPFNVGSYPILGGEGVDLDGDGEPDGVVDTDWGYYFDPFGPDGTMLSGDEPFQFTGYYMTFNVLSAIGLFEGLFEATYAATADLSTSFIFAADSTLQTFGAPSAISNAVVTSLADSLTTWISAGVAAYMAEGLSLEEATAKATEDALQGGLLQGIGGTELLAAAVPADDLFFSEFIEGGSSNKAFEIYNGTGADVDLSNYYVLGNYNGNPFSDTLRFPAGTMLANGDVYVVANEKADSLIIAEADSIIEDPYGSGTSYIAVFNGDDVRGLFKLGDTDTTCIDLFGFYDLTADTSEDPGSGWDVAGVAAAAKDHTLVRKSNVNGGNTDWTASAGTDDATSEWVVLDKDTFTDLGGHSSDYLGWTFPDDSDHDYNGVNGRLVFQIGNSCVPNLQTRDVYAIFSKINLGIESDGNIPLEFAVHENYPNPFNPTTKIRVDLPEASPTEVTVWNMLGQKVATLYAGDLNAGSHSITFNARNDNGIMLPSGVYIYRVESGSHIAMKKMMLLK